MLQKQTPTHTCYSELFYLHRGLEQRLCDMELFIKKFLHWSNKSIPYIKMFICICNLKIIPIIFTFYNKNEIKTWKLITVQNSYDKKIRNHSLHQKRVLATFCETVIVTENAMDVFEHFYAAALEMIFAF